MILDDGTTQIVFPDEMLWPDEFNWSPVVSSNKYSTEGVLVVQQGRKQAGRPITLTGSAWADKSVVEQLYAATLLVDQQFTLTLHDSRTFNVMFDHSKDSVAQFSPVFQGQDTKADDQFEINTLFFIEVI